MSVHGASPSPSESEFAEYCSPTELHDERRGSDINTFEYNIAVLRAAVDGNGHVNNIEYIRWMQDAAKAHSDVVGCTAATVDLGATWVVRSHHIEYLRPSFEGEKLKVRTWISDAHRVRSKRLYEILSKEGEIRAKAWTDWVFVDVQSGRPKPIPEEIISLFANSGGAE